MQRQPLLNNLEQISRLTFFDLQERVAVMKESLEDDAIALCIKEVMEL